MLTLTSPAFANGAAIPARHTCDDADRSPALRWSGAPEGTRSFALIVHDPDAPDPARPQRDWVHWLAYDIPATTAALPEGAGNGDPAAPMHWAQTDAETSGYHGPCPPIGRHRYFFELYALDTVLGPLGARARRADLERAMQGHVLARAELMGTYIHAADPRRRHR
jgi:Raf kinase inhibitor-like YbhB/YbcL family protein